MELRKERVDRMQPRTKEIRDLKNEKENNHYNYCWLCFVVIDGEGLYFVISVIPNVCDHRKK